MSKQYAFGTGISTGGQGQSGTVLNSTTYESVPTATHVQQPPSTSLPEAYNIGEPVTSTNMNSHGNVSRVAPNPNRSVGAYPGAASLQQRATEQRPIPCEACGTLYNVPYGASSFRCRSCGHLNAIGGSECEYCCICTIQ